MNKASKIHLWLIPLFFYCGIHLSSAQITYGSKSAKIKDVINHIKRNTSIDIVYTKRNIDKLKDTKQIVHKKWDVIELLNSFTSNTGLIFTYSDTKTIILKVITNDIITLTNNIGGHVYNTNGQPLIGATIWDLGNDSSTQTERDGKFSLPVNEKSKIMVSFIGYENKILEKATNDMIIQLSPSDVSLDEVQITGYINTSKRLSTASIGSIDSNDLSNQVSNNVLSALNGRIAGVNVVQTSGIPGSGIKIKIRGDNTLGTLGYSNTDPLYIIDGVPQVNGNSSYDLRLQNNVYGMGGSSNVFSTLHPNNIERIDVLKDADATAIYGARGANGVVIITTKTGTISPINFEIDYGIGISKKQRNLHLISTADYLRLRNDALSNDAIEPNTNNAPDILVWDPNFQNDYHKTLTDNKPVSHTFNVSARGGTENIRFYTGLNIAKEGTIIEQHEYYKKYGVTNNINLNTRNNKFKSDFSTNYSEEKSMLPGSSFSDLLLTSPNYNGLNEDGSFHHTPYFENPLSAVTKKIYGKNSLLNLGLHNSYDITPDLVFKIVAGYSSLQNRGNTRIASTAKNPFTSMNTRGESNFSTVMTTNINIEPHLMYTKKINRHKIIGLLGGNYSTAKTKIDILNGVNYANDNQLSSIVGAGMILPSYFVNEYKYNSGFIRVSYDYDHRFLLNMNARKDASSRFSSNNSLETFYSIGAAWIVSKEKWLNNVDWLSFGKIKLSYGTTGNDRIENYLFLNNYVPIEIPYNNTVTLKLEKIPNPDLKWETTKKLEAGLSVGFFKDLLILDANVYRNITLDLINSETRPSQSGFTEMLVNVDATVENKGIELNLSFNRDFHRFSWSSNVSLALERNKLLKYNTLQQSSMANYYTVGAPIDAFINLLKYKFEKIDETSGRAVFTDLNNDGFITHEDRYIIPYKTPYTAGILNRLNYKNVSLSVFFKMENRLQNSYFVNSSINYFGDISNYDFSAIEYINSTIWPAPSTGYTSPYDEYWKLISSDAFTTYNKYIKLKDLSIEYNLPQHLLGTSSLRIATYLKGQNLWFWSSQKNHWDPETEILAYPMLRTYLFGCKLTF